MYLLFIFPAKVFKYFICHPSFCTSFPGADLTAREIQTFGPLQNEEAEASHIGSSKTMSYSEKILESHRNKLQV